MGALLDTQIPGGAATSARLAFDMAVGVVAWMHFRGHRWAPCLEMTAATLLRNRPWRAPSGRNDPPRRDSGAS